MNVENILGYGFIGLAFLLALLAFNLLTKEQKKDSPRGAMLISIFVFMFFSLVLAGGGAFLEYKQNQYKIRLEALAGVLDEKIIQEASQSQSLVITSLVNQLEEQLDQARADGLIE